MKHRDLKEQAIIVYYLRMLFASYYYQRCGDAEIIIHNN